MCNVLKSIITQGQDLGWIINNNMNYKGEGSKSKRKSKVKYVYLE